MAVVDSPSELQTLEDCLLNKSNNVGLHTRFRALFTLKSLKSEDAVNIIAKGLSRIYLPVSPLIFESFFFIQASATLLLC